MRAPREPTTGPPGWRPTRAAPFLEPGRAGKTMPAPAGPVQAARPRQRDRSWPSPGAKGSGGKAPGAVARTASRRPGPRVPSSRAHPASACTSRAPSPGRRPHTHLLLQRRAAGARAGAVLDVRLHAAHGEGEGAWGAGPRGPEVGRGAASGAPPEERAGSCGDGGLRRPAKEKGRRRRKGGVT